MPDAIQILTPCTVGNGWLRIINVGRYALTFYEKYKGLGVRVYVDPKKLEPFSEIKSWFFKLKPKLEQDRDLLMDEIQNAGSTICGFEEVKIDLEFIRHDCPELIAESRDGAERIRKIVADLKDFAHPGDQRCKETDINQGTTFIIRLPIGAEGLRED